MTTVNNPRPVWNLLKPCTLAMTCLLLSGCSLCNKYIENQTTKEDAQLAAFVLLTRSGDNAGTSVHKIVIDAKGDKRVEMNFNWNTITVANTPLMLFAKKQDAKQFQLSVFKYDSGELIPKASMNDFELIDSRDRKLTDIPLDTLLRVDLTFKVNGPSEPEDKYGTPASFLVLFKEATALQKMEPSQELQKMAPSH